MRLKIVASIALAVLGGLGLYLRAPDSASTADAPEHSSSTPASRPTPAESSEPPRQDATGVMLQASASQAIAPRAIESPAVDSPLIREQREKVIERITAGLRRIYEDLGREVGLGDAESAALIRLLAEQQLQLSDRNIDPFLPGGATAYEELQAHFRQEIAQQIGTERGRRLALYQDTINARFEVEEARRILDAAYLPLTESQRKSFIRAAIDGGAFMKQPAFVGGESSVAVLQEWLARIEQRDQKLLGVARGILSAQQFERYQTHVMDRRAAFDADIQRQEQRPPAR